MLLMTGVLSKLYKLTADEKEEKLLQLQLP